MKAFVSVLIASLSITCSAADTPDFSGEWKLDLAKSDYRGLPLPERFVRRIEHAEPEIKITDQESANGKESKSTVSLMTDGRPVSKVINGTPVSVNAAWDRESLVITSDVTNAGLKLRDRMSLSSDRQELKSKVALMSAQGEIELSLVFERQP
jgi:hypothetical protein